jgi:hypothetical protein
MKISICKHCKKEFNILEKPSGWMANHSRWCEYNPKRKNYNNKNAILAMNSKRKESGLTNQYTKAKLKGTNVPISPFKNKPGFFVGKKHTQETKKILKEKALNSSHRRLKKGLVYYKGIMLDSSWELALAKRLDELNIEWVRPQPIKWIDEDGIKHNYFADFYLPNYDLYLDPKNPYAINAQKKKLKCLLTQYKNIVILDTLEKCQKYNI